VRTLVADSGPLRYLVLIGEVDILPKLMGHVLIPPEVGAELDRPQTPAPVRTWIAAPPSWLTVRPGPSVMDPALAELDPGERAAIALALATGADVVLMDDRAGVRAALARGLAVLGTIGLLDRAARRGLADFEAASTRLRATNFRYPAAMLDTLLEEHRRRAVGTSPDDA
jgi:predicted nucleic acid-binding protein